MTTPHTPFDWSAVTWSTNDGHPATGTRLQNTQIGANTWWRVVQHDYNTGTDTELYKYPHGSQAQAAYRWIITRDDRITSLATLRERITTEWTVDITDHDCLSDSREGAAVDTVTAHGLILRPRRPWSSQGNPLPTMTLPWSDCMVAVKNVVGLYRLPTSMGSRSTPGVPALVKTFRFNPPHTA